MGYKYDAGGYLNLKNEDDYRKVADIFDKYGQLDVSDFQSVKTREGTVLYCDVFARGYSYDEDNVMWSLSEIIPYVIEGQIDYEGEDSTLWRHEFNKYTKFWEELSGKVVYENAKPFAKKTHLEEEMERE